MQVEGTDDPYLVFKFSCRLRLHGWHQYLKASQEYRPREFCYPTLDMLVYQNDWYIVVEKYQLFFRWRSELGMIEA